MSAAYRKVLRHHPDTGHVTICCDPFHTVALGNQALDVVRRAYWNELRAHASPDDTRFKHAR